MAKKFTDLTAISAVADAVILACVDGSSSVKATFAQIKTWTQGWYRDETATLTNKAISGANNTLSNIGIASLAPGVVDTDGTLAANSDTRIAPQKAVKTYVDARLDAVDAFQFKGVVDCSANPNYPAASAGHTYKVSVAGKIGGASGVNVEVNDLLLCLVDSTASGNHATVGASWDIIQTNIDGAVIGPASSTSGNIATFSGASGKLLQDGGKALPSGAVVGTTDTQTLTNKAISGGTATGLTSLHATKGFQPIQAPMRSLMGGGTVMIGPAGAGAGANQTITPGKLNVYLMEVPDDWTFTKWYLRVATGVAGSNCRVGVWNDVNGSIGGTPLYDSGSQSTATSATTLSPTISLALAAGRYWVGTVFDAAPSVVCISTMNGAQGLSPGSATFAPILGYSRTFSYGALGDETGQTYTAITAAASAIAMVGFA